MNDIRDLKESILSGLLERGADCGECRITVSEKDELNVEQSAFSLMRTTFATSLTIQAIQGGRKGVITLNKTDPSAVNEAIDQVMTMLRSSTPDDAEGISELTENQATVHGPQAPDREAMFLRLQEFLEDVGIQYPKVGLEQVILAYCKDHTSYQNTKGVRLSHIGGYYSFQAMFNAAENGVAGSFCSVDSCCDSLDLPLLESALNRRLIADSQLQIAPPPFSGKFTGELIVSPACLGELLEAYVSNFLGDMPLISKTSVLQNQLGKKVASDCFTLRSLPVGGPFAVSARLDDGYPTRDTTVIDRGVLREFVLSRYGARRTGYPRAGNLFVSPSVDPGETSLEEMIRNVKEGVLMNRFSGGAPASNGDFSGIAKNSFLIRDGKLTAALSETMIAANLADMLRQISAISRERINFGHACYPYICFRNISISGK